jgi:hypothetical protein
MIDARASVVFTAAADAFEERAPCIKKEVTVIEQLAGYFRTHLDAVGDGVGDFESNVGVFL